MNNYIEIDSKRYKTMFGDWAPFLAKPGTLRYTLDGNLDATYGPAAPKGWMGMIFAPITTEGAQWGSYDDLIASLSKLQGLPFKDHYGVAGTAHITGDIPQDSRSPLFDSTLNEWKVMVRITLE